MLLQVSAVEANRAFGVALKRLSVIGLRFEQAEVALGEALSDRARHIERRRAVADPPDSARGPMSEVAWMSRG